ncbi:hypothetical protein J6590_021485 [Homalodisca vitripennis]|nr:hypothetical protein J6590_021485 [Homalodisca vitripennis]
MNETECDNVIRKRYLSAVTVGGVAADDHTVDYRLSSPSSAQTDNLAELTGHSQQPPLAFLLLSSWHSSSRTIRCALSGARSPACH